MKKTKHAPWLLVLALGLLAVWAFNLPIPFLEARQIYRGACLDDFEQGECHGELKAAGIFSFAPHKELDVMVVRNQTEKNLGIYQGCRIKDRFNWTCMIDGAFTQMHEGDFRQENRRTGEAYVDLAAWRWWLLTILD